MRALIAGGLLLLFVHVAGLATIGLVTSGSMEPTLSEGSLFFALRADPGVGDVVVFRGPDGARVVHRVADVTPDGLVTRGDANDATDQERGLPLVDPADVQVVPTVAGAPLAVGASWLTPAVVIAVQVGLLTWAVSGAFAGGTGKGKRKGKVARVGPRPHHALVVAGLALLVASPLMRETENAEGTLALSSGPVPTTFRVESGGDVSHVTLPPMSETTVPAQGPTDVVHVPAAPGARTLSAWGPVWGVLPAVAIFWVGAVLARRAEW